MFSAGNSKMLPQTKEFILGSFWVTEEWNGKWTGGLVQRLECHTAGVVPIQSVDSGLLQATNMQTWIFLPLSSPELV